MSAYVFFGVSKEWFVNNGRFVSVGSRTSDCDFILHFV